MTAGQQRLYKRTWSAAGSFTSTDINYYINADCQEGGIPAHTTSVKNIGPFFSFFFFFFVVSKKKHLCVVCCKQHHTAAHLRPPCLQPQALPKVTPARSRQSLQDYQLVSRSETFAEVHTPCSLARRGAADLLLLQQLCFEVSCWPQHLGI